MSRRWNAHGSTTSSAAATTTPTSATTAVRGTATASRGRATRASCGRPPTPARTGRRPPPEGRTSVRPAATPEADAYDGRHKVETSHDGGAGCGPRARARPRRGPAGRDGHGPLRLRPPAAAHAHGPPVDLHGGGRDEHRQRRG